MTIDDSKKHVPKSIPDEAFKRGAELITYQESKPTKKQLDKKQEEIDNFCPFGEMSEEEFEQHIKYFDYKINLKCPYCEGYIRNVSHIKNHNIDIDEFKDIYGGTSPLDIVATKIMQWYSPNTNKWALQQPFSEIDLPYMTYTKEKQKEKNNVIHKKFLADGTKPIYHDTYLRPELLRKHLRYSSTISVYPWGDRAGWICLDIDTEQDAFEDTKKIVNTMIKYGINRENILVSFSGGKGFHVELFFQYAINYKQIKFLGEKICNLAGADIKRKQNTGKIEIRPTSEKGIKLPLGLNRRTGKKCKVLDTDFNELEFQHDELIYFLNMNKVENKIISNILNSKDKSVIPVVSKEEIENPKEVEEPDPPEELKIINSDNFDDEDEDEYYYQYTILPSLESKIKMIERKYDDGLRTTGTRNQWIWQIALWFRDIQGLDEDIAEELLIAWTMRNLEYIKNENDAIKNVKDVIKFIFGLKGIKYSLEKGRPKTLYFYPEEVQLVKKIQKQGKKEMGAKTDAPSLLYFTFLCLSKYFKRKNKKSFFVSREDLAKYSGLANRTINTWFNWLIYEKKYITLIRQGNSFEKIANEYAIPLLHTSIHSKKPFELELEINDLNIRELYNKII